MNYSTKDAIIQFVAEHQGISVNLINEKTILIGGELDSLSVVELVMDVEDKFDIVIADEQWENVKTVGELIEVADKQLKSRYF